MLAAGTRYGTVQLWDVEQRRKRATLTGHRADVWAVAFSPDGRIVASGDGDWDRPGQVILWDPSTGRQETTLRHSGEVLCMAFAPDARTLAAGSWDRTVRLWHLSCY
jgi:WD40 repeat protein